MRGKSILHFIRSGLKSLQEVTMSTLKIIEDVCELNRNGFRTERKNPVYNMICTHLIGWIQVAGFGGGLEGPHDDSRWIGA
jgi:hypothetical protein